MTVPTSSPARSLRLVGAAVVLCAGLGLAACSGGTSTGAPNATAGGGSAGPVLSGPLIVVSSHTSAAWVRLLRAQGVAAREGTWDEMTARGAGVIPADAGVSTAELSALPAWVRAGGRVATPEGEVFSALGIRQGAFVNVSSATMDGLDGAAQWPDVIAVQPLTGPGWTVEAHSSAGATLMGSKPLGKGEVLALAVDPLAGQLQGYELMPWAASVVASVLGAPPGPALDSAQVYVDPGGLSGPQQGSPDHIAAALSAMGARVALVAGWNFDFNNPAQDYDYSGLINALHARGILAYAWLEPPFVTLRMWDDHPECREITETGRQAIVDWRRLIALEDPKCMTLALAAWDHLASGFAWDGIDVAELYFEPSIDPANYTPFSAAALAQFGGDPRTDPARFLSFRQDLEVKLNDAILRNLNGLPGASQLGLQLTIIDDSLDPAAAAGVGADDARLAQVARSDGAQLIVEDPFTTWTRGPLRYSDLGPHVASLMPPGDALLDINVVPRSGAKPTSTMTGSELELAAGAATTSTGTMAVYSLGTLSDSARRVLAGAMAYPVTVTDTGVITPWTIVVRAPDQSYGRLTVDGVSWPAGPGRAVVPAGQHQLQWAKGAPLGPALLGFTGRLGTASTSPGAVSFSYDSRPDALAVLSARPTSVTVDGKGVTPLITADPDGGVVLRLPEGTHQVALGF